MEIFSSQHLSELKEFKCISRNIYLRCLDLHNVINATGRSNEVYEDPRELSRKLNEEVRSIDISAYTRNYSLYTRLFKLVKIIYSGLEDYDFISKQYKQFEWLIIGMVGGSEAFEYFLHDIIKTLKSMKHKMSGKKKQTTPLKRIQKLCHMLDRVKSEETKAETRIKAKLSKLLESGVRDLTKLVRGCRKSFTENCPNEPTCGYVLRELKWKGYRLSYDTSGVLYDNGDDPFDTRREVFNTWQVSDVSISYMISLFTILNNGEVVFKSFDGHLFKLAGTREINGHPTVYWRLIPGGTVINSQVRWRRYFPSCRIKRRVTQEVHVLGYWSKLADKHSEEHKWKVKLLKDYMLKLHERKGNHIRNPRLLAAELSNMAMRSSKSEWEGRLLVSNGVYIKRAIVANKCLLSNISNDRFASWVIASVSESNLKWIGTGDLRLWSHLNDNGGLGSQGRFNIRIQRSQGGWFEDKRCDVEVTLNVPSIDRHEVIRGTEHLASIINDLSLSDNKQIYDLGTFFIRKLLCTNANMKTLSSAGDPNVQIFSASRTMEITPLPKICDMVRKEEEGWDSEDLDTIPNSEFIKMGRELTSWDSEDLNTFPYSEFVKMGLELTRVGWRHA